jgi:RNA polymerase-binding transcription factor DksA
MKKKKKANKKTVSKSRKKSKTKKTSLGRNIITFPARLLSPVAKLLQFRLKDLKKKKKTIDQEDPFKNTNRVLDNASPDTDAYEQFGHARTSAIKEQLDRKIIQTKKALTRIKIGKYGTCEDCGKMIDTDRLMVYPEATLCADCKLKREK